MRVFLSTVALVLVNVSGQKVLPLHSFDQSIDYETFASRWFNAGTCIPLENHIVLSPSVSDRYGAQWHKYPLLTDDFEVSFKVVIKGTYSQNSLCLDMWICSAV